MKKQIDEMAEILAKNFTLYDGVTTFCAGDFERCAYQLMQNGYRKETQGEWIEHIEKPHWLEDCVEVYYRCSVCGTSHWSITPPYCPNCGAKMRGE